MVYRRRRRKVHSYERWFCLFLLDSTLQEWYILLEVMCMSELALVNAYQLAQLLKLPMISIRRYTESGLIPYISCEGGEFSYNPQAIQNYFAQQILRYRLDYGKYPFSAQDNMTLPETVLRTEILDGLLIKEPASTINHQLVLGNVLAALSAYFKNADPSGKVFLSPLNVILSDTVVVQPDIFYLSSSRKEFISTWVLGPPHLAVEIVDSDSNCMDRIIKNEIYQRFAIPYYWMVDIDARLIEFYTLDQKGLYHCTGIHSSGTITVPDFPDLALNIEKLWA